jgi:isopenicillin-N N-acyltransferase like protein
MPATNHAAAIRAGRERPFRRLAVFTALALAALVLLGVAAAPLVADENPRTFTEGRSGPAELRYVNGLPVLSVAGSPEEIGRQKAALAVGPLEKLADYPKQVLALVGRGGDLPRIIERGRRLLENTPADHRAEMRAFAEAAGMDADAGILANTFPDLYRGGFGCSSLIVEPSRSATGAPIFGRNLDFINVGTLNRYTLVTVYRPEGKRAFASVAFPGLFGCLSGMNDAGLALAVHEVYVSRDGSPMFDPEGVPYTFLFREILETCKTVDEAEKLLRSRRRTTKLNLAVCDRQSSAVFEFTPKTVAVRRAEDGLLACTNHFRTEDLIVLALCRRYGKLRDVEPGTKLDLDAVAAKLHEVNQGRLTIQTMVFEPVELRLHLAVGSCPSSALPLRRLDLRPMFGDAGEPAGPSR